MNVLTAGLLLWQCSMLTVLFSMSFVCQFNLNTPYVHGDAAVGYDRCLHHSRPRVT